VIEVSAEVSDFVVGLIEGDGRFQVSLAYEGHLLLQFHHGALNEVGKNSDGDSADDDGSGTGKKEEGIAVGVAQGEGRNGEEDQAGEEHEDNGQDRLHLPIDSYIVHSGKSLSRDGPILRLDMHVVFQRAGRDEQCGAKGVKELIEFVYGVIGAELAEISRSRMRSAPAGRGRSLEGIARNS
jgi:hypothetical protein